MDSNILVDYFMRAPYALGLSLFAVLPLLLLWFLRNWITPYDDHKVIFADNNLAVALERLSFMFAAAMPIAAAISDYNRNEQLYSFGVLGVKALVVVVLLITLRPVIDWATHSAEKNDRLLLEGNMGIACAMAGANVGVGLIVAGAMTGSAPTVTLNVVSTVVFALLGMAVLVGATRLYQWIAYRHDHAADASAEQTVDGIRIGGAAAAAGMIISLGTQGDFHTWTQSLIGFGATTLVSLILLVAHEWVVQRVITAKGSAVTVAGAVTVALTHIVTSYVLAAAIYAAL